MIIVYEIHGNISKFCLFRKQEVGLLDSELPINQPRVAVKELYEMYGIFDEPYIRHV